MNKYLLALCASILLLEGTTASNQTYFSENLEEVKARFEAFKTKFNKKYRTPEEESKRFEIFKQSLKNIDERNLNEIKRTQGYGNNFERAVYGITKFSDLTKEEFSKILGTKPVPKSQLNAPHRRKPDDDSRKLSFIFNSEIVDWSDKYITDIKDQGYCGSCWAFATAEQAESDAIRTLGKDKVSYILSPGQVTQCTKGSYGCDGGFFQSGLNYLKEVGALYSADYPYLSYYGNTAICLADTNQAVKDRIEGIYTLIGQEELTAHVYQTGPIAAVVNADNWQYYESGVMVEGCDITGYINHAIQVVGVLPDEVENGGFWKIRNSWGTEWGEEGFIRIAYNMNACLIDEYGSFVTYKDL